MADQLVAVQIESDRRVRHAAQGAAQAVYIKPFCFFQIGHWKSQMKQDLSHGQLSEEVHLLDGGGRFLPAIEKCLEFSEILPQRLVEIALMQCGRGMQHGEDEKLLDLEDLPAHLHDADLFAQ